MSGFVDEISPKEIGSDRIRLSLAAPTSKPRAFDGVQISVDYSDCPTGVTPPLLFSVLAPSAENYEERVIQRQPPTALVWIPREGGIHTVTIRELYHMKYFGTLEVEVEGDPLDAEA